MTRWNCDKFKKIFLSLNRFLWYNRSDINHYFHSVIIITIYKTKYFEESYVMNLFIGEKIVAKTNAEFLNLLFGTNYKQYMRSIYNISNDSVVWMIRIDSTERSGFKNYFEDDYIVEYSSKNPTRSYKLYRYVFQIIEEDKKRKYVYLGKYRFCSEKSTLEKRYFVLTIE